MSEYPECVHTEDRILVNGHKEKRWRTKVICPDCGRERYVDFRNVNRALKKGNFTGSCPVCNGQRIGRKNTKLRAKKNHRWKGGRNIGYGGYVLRTIQPDNPFFEMTDSTNRIREHRLVIAKHLDRSLLPTEHVHHIDGNRSNNRIGNLVLMTNMNHRRFEILLQKRKVRKNDALFFGIYFGDKKGQPNGTKEGRSKGGGPNENKNSSRSKCLCEYVDGKQGFIVDHNRQIKNASELQVFDKTNSKCLSR